VLRVWGRKGEAAPRDKVLSRPHASPSYQAHHFAKLGQRGDSAGDEEADLWQRDLGRQR